MPSRDRRTEISSCCSLPSPQRTKSELKNCKSEYQVNSGWYALYSKFIYKIARVRTDISNARRKVQLTFIYFVWKSEVAFEFARKQLNHRYLPISESPVYSSVLDFRLKRNGKASDGRFFIEVDDVLSFLKGNIELKALTRFKLSDLSLLHDPWCPKKWYDYIVINSKGQRTCGAK